MPAGPPPAMQQRVERVSSIVFVSQPSKVELVALDTLIFRLVPLAAEWRKQFDDRAKSLSPDSKRLDSGAQTGYLPITAP